MSWSRPYLPALPALALIALAALGCSDSETSPIAVEPEPVGWVPGRIPDLSRQPGPRGTVDLRGVIHAHSVYSHDACDGDPRDEETDAINQECFDDLRRDLCTARHAFVMLTDHDDSFARTEFPEVLLHRPNLGDVLVEREGRQVASWAACEDGSEPALILAGTETATMPVGLEGHVAATEQERDAVYGAATPEAVATYKAHGAVALVQHTEDWTPEQIIDLGLDGFEMYNLHRNALVGAPEALELVLMRDTPELLPHPDLSLLVFISEDPVYLETWGTVLARGAKRSTIIATDCHRNTFATEMQDGERMDSYRRMMVWMSNHLLVRPSKGGSWDDSHLKEALRAGRLYGSFDVMGYPQGFDFHALAAGATHEMGEEVSLANGVELVATMPTVYDLDPAGVQPEVLLRLLRAKEGGWETVEETSEDLHHEPQAAGAYRVEARMRPKHLLPYLSSFSHLADEDFVWVYSTAIYVSE